jgi:hypothetical protein
MRAFSHILTAALLAGCVSAQIAPASQTVKPAQKNTQQTPAKTAASSKTPAKGKTVANPKAPVKTAVVKAAPQSANTKAAAKSPFAPKTKAVSAPATSAKVAPTPVKGAPQSQTTAAKKPTSQNTATAKVLSNPAQKPAQKSATSATAKIAPKTQPKHQETKSAAKIAAPASAPEKKAEAAPAPVAQSEPAKLPNPGKRDPFLSPLAMAAARGNAANCTTGKKCLVVDQILLKGIVQMKGGNLALVENGAKRPYVLHENDSLFNGAVVKITGDSIILREEGSDILGRPVSKEVVKKVSAPAV